MPFCWREGKGGDLESHCRAREGVRSGHGFKSYNTRGGRVCVCVYGRALHALVCESVGVCIL